MQSKETKSDVAVRDVKSTTLKVNDVTVNIHSCFYSEKSLFDILYLLVNTELKEKLHDKAA